MLKFIDYSYENLKDYAPYIARCTYLCADFSLGSVFMWHERVNMQFAIYHNTFVMKLDMGDEPAFSYPIGEDVEGALDALEELVKVENWPLMFFGINEEILQQIKNSCSHSRAMPSFPSQLEWKIGLAWANTRGSLNSPS